MTVSSSNSELMANSFTTKSPLGRAAVCLVIVAMAATSLLSGGVSMAVIDAPGVTGTVRLDGGGVVGATVEVIDSGIIVGTATTTGSGAFEISLAGPGVVDLRVTPPVGVGASAQTITGVVVPPAPAFATVDVAIRRLLATLDVNVVDGAGDPATGVVVRLLNAGNNAGVDTATTDAAGHVRLRAPGDRQYGLRLTSGAETSLVLPKTMLLTVNELVQPTVAGTTITLAIPTATLNVGVEDSGGTSLPGTPVVADSSPVGLSLGSGFTANGSASSSGSADIGGQVELATITGAANVEASPRSGLLLRTSTSVPVSGPATSATIVVAAAPTADLTVTLLDGAGVPVPDAQLRGAETARTDSLGTATVLIRTDLSQTASVAALSDGLLDLPDRLYFSRPTPPAGSDTLQPVLATLAVDVVDQLSNAPITGAIVTITSPTFPASGAWTVKSIADSQPTDGAGRATFRLVPGSGYVATVRSGTDRIGSSPATLAGGGTTTIVSLPAAPAPVVESGFFSIRGRVVTPAGTPVAGISVQSTVRGATRVTGVDGTFSTPVNGAPGTSHGLWLRGTNLLAANGSASSVPDQINVWTAPFVAVGLESVDVGDVVLPLDQLDVQVTDESGGGLALLNVNTDLSGGSTDVSIGGASVRASAQSGYVTTGVRLDNLGEGTLHLFRGSYDVTVAEQSLSNFADVDFPVTESGAVTAGNDTLRLVLQRRYGAPFTTLNGSPAESQMPLTLQLPEAVVTPDIDLPLQLAGGSVGSSSVEVSDRWWCGERNRTVVFNPDDCTEGLLPIVLTDLNRSGFSVFPPGASYPLTLPVVYWSTVIADIPGVGSTFIREGTRSGEIVLLAPIDEVPTMSLGAPPAPSPEGSLVQLTATGSDAEGPVTVSWDLDDDGIPDAEGPAVWVEALDGPSSTPITAFVTDSNGRSVTAATAIESLNAPPTGILTLSGPTADQVTAEVTDLSDPAVADIGGLTVMFDTDGNGTFESNTNPVTFDVSSRTDGSYDVTARITDDDGGSTDVTQSFTVTTPTTTTTTTTTTTVRSNRSLSSTVSGPTSPVAPGDVARINVSLTNASPAAATNVAVTVRPGSGLSPLTGSQAALGGRAIRELGSGPGWTCTTTDPAVCSLPALPAGATSELTIELTVGATADGSVRVDIDIAADDFDATTASVLIAIAAPDSTSSTTSTTVPTIIPVTGLPATGGQTSGPLAIAVSAFLIGLAMLAASRRRRPTERRRHAV